MAIMDDTDLTISHGNHRRMAKRDSNLPSLTLLRQGSPLSSPRCQVSILESASDPSLPTFKGVLAERGLEPLRAAEIEVLQVNLGKLCNQTCRHCHVDAGPDRREVMGRETVDECLAALRRSAIPTLDITGGAPELNPHFRYLVREARQMGRRVIDRSNLTILLAPGFTDLPEFLAGQGVEVIASLPCYLEENCDRQRGSGVFQRSIEALRRLNECGYGQGESSLSLTLVYNPLGPSLPPAETKLEADYRRELRERYGVEFTRLITITNMPISRFLDDLLASGKYESYMRTLVEAFNPSTVEAVMCRTTLSVDWQGRLFDCDFNQMLDLEVVSGIPRHIRDFDLDEFANRRIVTRRHCFGCTAGAGSSCQGSIVSAATEA
jgi:radical SAM/Cys-rich protein